jgi:SPP1 family predicted phage head-tail adaptor
MVSARGLIPVPVPLQSGQLRHTITIRREQDVADGKGGYNRTWVDIAPNIRAEVVSENGREAFAGHVLQGINNYLITIRYISGIKPSDQIKWSGEELNILSAVDPDGRRKRIEIRANNQVPQGA